MDIMTNWTSYVLADKDVSGLTFGGMTCDPQTRVPYNAIAPAVSHIEPSKAGDAKSCEIIPDPRQDVSVLKTLVVPSENVI